MLNYDLISNKNWTKSMQPRDEFIFHQAAAFKEELSSSSSICKSIWGGSRHDPLPRHRDRDVGVGRGSSHSATQPHNWAVLSHGELQI